ncbi:MAG: ring-cleaving dioxygenase [Anaerolineales bacterium]|nr:ring-cleaving dioxygenase [Anaerolineales bacterium]
MPPTLGIHHITAIGSDPQRLVDFYTQILGLRLVKKTVNQDDVSAYHLFFGDREGGPGMDLTFFTFLPASPGSRGNGLVTNISLAVPTGALPFWKERFDTLGVKHEGIITQLGWQRIVFYDYDDQRLELVEVDPATFDDKDLWTTPDIRAEHAIRQFHSALLSVHDKRMVEPILAAFGYEVESSEGNLTRYHLPGLQRAEFLELEEDARKAPGFNASGTVHHIAFSVADEEAQQAVRRSLSGMGLYPTTVIDRFYFKSVYFRTPAGILFELATMGPGFTADEPLDTLGEALSLPPFLEEHRAQIEAGLTPVTVRPLP